MKLRPMLQVADVAAASQWYQHVLGLRSGHGGDEFEMLFDGDDDVLHLHRLDAHEHGELRAGTEGQRGAGVSLWFELADRAAVEQRVEVARAAGADVVSDAQWNPIAHHYEAMLRDRDGYVVMVNSPFSMEP